MTEGVAPFAEEAESPFDDLFGCVAVADVNHFVAPPRTHGWRGNVGHEFRERLHGADGGGSESERFLESAANGVQAHGRIELPLDGVQFLDPAGETFWPANGKPHRGVVEVGVCVNETWQEGNVTHFLNGGFWREEG